jgi:hypothetical protein
VEDSYDRLLFALVSSGYSESQLTKILRDLGLPYSEAEMKKIREDLKRKVEKFKTKEL